MLVPPPAAVGKFHQRIEAPRARLALESADARCPLLVARHAAANAQVALRNAQSRIRELETMPRRWTVAWSKRISARRRQNPTRWRWLRPRGCLG